MRLAAAFPTTNTLQGITNRIFCRRREEIDRASRKLAAHGDKVDYIVTHDAPVRLQRFIDIEDADHLNHLHTFLEEVSKTIDFRFWYCGKYHQNRIIPPRYRMLFTDVVKAE